MAAKERAPRWLRESAVPTAAGWVLLQIGVLLAAVSIFTGEPPLMAIGIALVAIVLVSWVIALVWRPKAQVQRSISPEHPRAWTEALVEVSITNVGKRSIAGGAIIDGVDVANGIVAQAWTDDVGPGATSRVNYIFLPERRGVHSIGPLAHEARDRLSFVRTLRHLDKVQPVLVYPRTSETRIPSFRAIDAPMTLNALHAVANPDDVSVREYRRGDALRRINWRATARSGSLIVRQEEPRTQPGVLVLLYAGEGVGPQWGPRFERSVEVAASLIESLYEHGFEAELAVVGGTGITEDARHQTSRGTAGETLARVQPGGGSGLTIGAVGAETPVIAISAKHRADFGWLADVRSMNGGVLVHFDDDEPEYRSNLRHFREVALTWPKNTGVESHDNGWNELGLVRDPEEIVTLETHIAELTAVLAASR